MTRKVAQFAQCNRLNINICLSRNFRYFNPENDDYEISSSPADESRYPF